MPSGSEASAPPGGASGGYDPGYYEPLFQVEDRHFWFAGRAAAIEAVVGPLVRALPAGYRVLEIGCGTGHVLARLERLCRGGRVIGMDLYREGLRYARRRTTCPLLQASSTEPPFTARFDIVGLFDVLEHLEDDREFLRRTRALLGDRGALVLTVPAHPSLWSRFDERSHHCRRYRRVELADRLREAGYVIDYLSEFLVTTFPLVWASRRLARMRQGQDPVLDDLRIRPALNPVLRWILVQEARLIGRGRRLPIGTSLIAVARPARSGAAA